MDFVSLTKTKINNGINKIFLSAITFAHRKALRYQLLTNWHICNAISIQNSSNYSAFTWNWALSFLLAHSHWSTVNTQDEKYKNLSSQWKIETNTPNDEFMIYYTHKCSSLNLSSRYVQFNSYQQKPWIIIYPSLETDNFQLFYFRRQFEHNGVE